MIDGKTIKFGNKSVLVRSSELRTELTLQSFQPKNPIYSTVVPYLNNIDLLEKITLEYGHDMRDFLKSLNSISTDRPRATFRGYLFDFSNCDKKTITTSLKTVINGFENTISAYQLLLAV